MALSVVAWSPNYFFVFFELNRSATFEGKLYCTAFSLSVKLNLLMCDTCLKFVSILVQYYFTLRGHNLIRACKHAIIKTCEEC